MSFCCPVPQFVHMAGGLCVCALLASPCLPLQPGHTGRAEPLMPCAAARHFSGLHTSAGQVKSPVFLRCFSGSLAVFTLLPPFLVFYGFWAVRQNQLSLLFLTSSVSDCCLYQPLSIPFFFFFFWVILKLPNFPLQIRLTRNGTVAVSEPAHLPPSLSHPLPSPGHHH